MNYQGYIIYRERVRRNWSQSGLCKGICTVSYLSKIESGRAEPSAEILRLLLARLNLETNRDVEREAAGLAERGWELLLTGRRGQLHGLLGERDIERYRAVPAWLDLALLSAQTPLEPALEPCMDVRQLAIQRILQRQEAEAVRLMPNAYTHLMLGIADYNAGSYSAAVDALQTAYDLAGWKRSSFSAMSMATGRICPTWSATIGWGGGWRRICRMKAPCGRLATTPRRCGSKPDATKRPTLGFPGRSSPP